MQLDSRPISIPPRDWPDQSSASRPSHPPSASSAFMNTSSMLSQRRRSSAAHSRPAAPPPNHPIPSIPSQPSSPPRTGPATPEPPESPYYSLNHINGSQVGYPYARPGGSANLAAVAAYPSSRTAASSTSYSTSQSSHSPSASSSVDNLSDPPPRSSLPPSRRSPEQVPRVPNDNYLLTPPEPRSTRESKPSSRRALMRALELAREAVSLDSTNDDPIAAVQAYGKSVALLSEVMERVRRGEDSTDPARRKNSRRRSIVAQEEEVRRLKSIHDTYADRMNILSLIYSIPPMPHSTASVYSTMSASTDSTTQPSSPASTSPTSDASESLQQSSYPIPGSQDDYGNDQHTGHDRDDTVGMLFGIDALSQPTPAVHPYAPRSEDDPVPATLTPSANASPSRTISRRPRSGSVTLPPLAPPPSSPPPPPPVLPSEANLDASAQTGKHLEVAPLRQRGDSVTHKRTSSGIRLAALQEESERPEEATQGEYRKSLLLDTPKTSKRESHPLPPLPPPSSSDGETPTMRERAPPSAPRQRGASQPVRSESSSNLINDSTNQGTIYQRRSKHSTTSTPRSTSPTGSTASIGSLPPSKSIPSRAAANSLPSLGASPVTTRNRAFSQPDRRINGRGSPDPPPLPVSAGVNGPFPRKMSNAYRSNSGPHLPPLQTDVPLSAGPPTSSLIPPPPALSIPTTPPSPLPPIAPADPLRKPYYMMGLLMTTMTSPTGGYITRRLHVPQEVWSQGGVKLGNIPDKIRVVEILCSSLEELQVTSAESFGAGNVSSGMALGIGSIGRKEGEAWVMRLEEFSACCDNVVANFGKKLSVGEGFAVKKTSGWGNRVARGFDRLTNVKNLDSPAAYVQGLKQLFQHAQLLDEHARAVLSHPMAPSYAALPLDLRSSAEAKLRRSSEFFASVVLTFVIRDLSRLLDKYAKNCEKWLAE